MWIEYWSKPYGLFNPYHLCQLIGNRNNPGLLFDTQEYIKSGVKTGETGFDQDFQSLGWFARLFTPILNLQIFKVRTSVKVKSNIN